MTQTQRLEQDLRNLRAARDLISDPIRWTQGAAARDNRDIRVNPLSPNAVAWCAIGAMDKIVGGEEALPMAIVHLTQSGKLMCGLGIVNVNDKMGHSAVMRVYDNAIARIESRLAQERRLERGLIAEVIAEKIEKVEDEELVLV